MKKVIVFVSVVAIGILAVAAGCTPKEAAPAPQAVGGTITSINTPDQPGPDQVVVQTPAGQQTFILTPNTDISYNNTACAIEDAGKLVSQNGTTYTCTVVYDETYHAIALGIYQQAE